MTFIVNCPKRRAAPVERNAHASDNEEDHKTFLHDLKQSNSYGNLTDAAKATIEHNFNIDTTTVKRNKSFWRFSKSEDILLEGMALWKHRDLVSIENDDMTGMMMKKQQQHEAAQRNAAAADSAKANKTETLKKKSSNNSSTNIIKAEGKSKKKSIEGVLITTNEKQRAATEVNNKKGFHEPSGPRKRSEMKGYDAHGFDDEDLYDETPKRRNDQGPSRKAAAAAAAAEKLQHDNDMKHLNESFSMEFQDANFYDDDTVLMRTVRRKEILKQYYSSGTDTEVSSSDPYDCIIMDERLVPAANTSTFRKKKNFYEGSDKPPKNETGTLLPRLSKSSRNVTAADQADFKMSKTNTAKSYKTADSKNSFGPWLEMWSDNKSMK